MTTAPEHYEDLTFSDGSASESIRWEVRRRRGEEVSLLTFHDHAAADRAFKQLVGELSPGERVETVRISETIVASEAR